MNDALKGLSILAVTALSISIVLSMKYEWEIPFLATAGGARNSASELQRQILAGADPTLLQEPTAAGDSRTCFNGALYLADDNGRQQHEYLSVVHGSRLYIRLKGQEVILEAPYQPSTEQEAFTVDSVPVFVATRLADMANDQTDCISKPMTLSLLAR